MPNLTCVVIDKTCSNIFKKISMTEFTVRELIACRVQNIFDTSDPPNIFPRNS